MSAPALAAPAGRALTIRGRPYPVLLPRLSDPRLHLAAVIISLQVLGQVAFDFRLSIAQILIAIGTCAILEMGIAFFGQHVLMWPASAMLTGNGVAFVLRVPGTEHGDWWSLNGWTIFAGTAAVSLLSKYVIKFRGSHIFNPSNFGLVLCFLLLGPEHAEPLDFWWGPMTGWLALALGIIVVGGLAILIRLRLIVIAVAFWVTFAAALAVLMGLGHAFSARWHLGPVTGHYFWWVLVTSPEVLVFLFFMITDPKTTPKSTRGRALYAVSIGLLSVLLIAPAKTEFWAKVALLGALAIVCAARPLIALVPRLHLDRRVLVALGAAALVAYTGAIAGAGIRARPATGVAPLEHTGRLPQVTILPSRQVQTVLKQKTARRIAADLVADLQTQTAALIGRRQGVLARTSIGDELNALTRQIDAAKGGPIEVPAYRVEQMHVHLERGHGQGGAIAVAKLAGSMQLASYTAPGATLVRREAPASLHETLELQAGVNGRWLVAHVRSGRPLAVIPPATTSAALLAAAAKGFAGIRFTDVARQAGLNFTPGQLPLWDGKRRPLDDGRRPLLARLQQRRPARPLRRQLVLRRRHGQLGATRRAAAERPLRERRRRPLRRTSVPGRTPTRPSRGTAASRPTSTATATPTSSSRRTPTTCCSGTTATARSRTARTPPASTSSALRLAHRRRGRRRQRRRTTRHLRLRLRRRERARSHGSPSDSRRTTRRSATCST